MPSFLTRVRQWVQHEYRWDRLRARFTRLPSSAIHPTIARVLGRMDAPVLFELGANDGSDTRRLVTYPKNGCSACHAFEPDPRNIAKFRARGLPDGVTLVEAAVGATDGRVVLQQSILPHPGHPEMDFASSSLRPPTGAIKDLIPAIQFEGQVEAAVVSLDSYCETHGVDRIDFLWADIEGGERDLIAGARRMLPHIRVMFLEQEGYRLFEGQWLFPELMAALGQDWKLAHRFPSNVLLYNRRLASPDDLR